MAASAATEPADTLTLGEVTVSAVKGAGDDAAATVLTRQAVERHRLLSPRDVTAFAPNVFIPDYGSRMTSTIYVRGIGARIDQPSLGLTIDNVPVMSKENYNKSREFRNELLQKKRNDFYEKLKRLC